MAMTDIQRTVGRARLAAFKVLLGDLCADIERLGGDKAFIDMARADLRMGTDALKAAIDFSYAGPRANG